jgi:hypothetical protein
MLPEIVSYLKTHWKELDVFEARPCRFSYLMQDRNRPSCFIFADGESQPRFIAKFASTEANRLCLHREHEMITIIHDLTSPEIGATVPSHLALLTSGWDLAAIETILPGTPMAPTDVFTGERAAIERQFTLVYEWLLAFQDCTRRNVLLDGPELQRVIVDPLAERLPNLDISTDVRTNIENVLILAEALEGCVFPLTFSHGDMNPTNFLLDRGRVTGVVDWEWAGRESLPTMDWFNFVHLFGWITLLHRRDYPSFGASRSDAIQTTFFTDNSFSWLAKEWTAKFFAHYGWDNKFTTLLLFHALFKLYPVDAMLEEIIREIAAATDNSLVPFIAATA